MLVGPQQYCAKPVVIFKFFIGKKKDNLATFICDEMASCWLENIGNGKFTKHVLPMEAQFAPVNAMICYDFDKDGINDLLLAGNEYQTEVMTGMYDASYGCFLKGDKTKTFHSMPSASSGFIVDGDVRDMEEIHFTDNERILLVAVNNDLLRVFRITSFPQNLHVVKNKKSPKS